MSPEAQRIAIAEACGWLVEHRDDGLIKWTVLVSPEGQRIDSTSGIATLANFGCIPDYLGDLNAIHGAEIELLGPDWDEEKWAIYKTKLYQAIEPHRHVINSTAAQRSKALLNVIGKWTE